MFKKILIANRGEIACRVAATARRLGVQTVAVYSDADARAKHVSACDEAVHIGGSAPQESYLQWQCILDAARATGAQAIHPGYGFLSENADFARACAATGLVFIGPPASAIEAMGLKAESKRLMQAAGVPLVPGYHGTDQDSSRLQREADAIGYPVLIKASAGGGGRGMRRVDRAEDFADALASCRREAASAFGNDAVLIEKYVQRPRHIEIQVFADSHGNVVHLFERDCSVQRRHQKVLEEAPAPGLTTALREQMGVAAVAAAKAVGYVGAGTVEFIVEQPEGYDSPEAMRFYFMEMNTRLQVEHPVTEAVTGEDLVAWQLRVACGEALPRQQHGLRQQGHAIEARICAENPTNGFLPATGMLQVYRTPNAARFELGAVRLDDGVREGDVVSPFYDSMIAKLIVHGDTREEALARLDVALSQIAIVGVANNVAFLRRVVATESFARAQLDTALIEREHAALFATPALPRPWAVAAVATRVLDDEEALAQAHDDCGNPFARRDGWQSHGERTRRLTFTMGDGREAAVQVGVTLTRVRDGEPGASGQVRWRLQADGEPAQALCWTVLEANGALLRLSVQLAPEGQTAGTQRRELRVARTTVDGESRFVVWGPEGQLALTWPDMLALAGGDAPEGGRLTAPMPGKVLRFAVQAGAQVRKGELIAVIEAMKMEHPLTAPSDGRVQALLFAEGDQVREGDALLTLDAD